jgi:hypothetical protein
MKLDIKINFKNGYDAITDKDTKAEKERNDCVVRALMNAFEISYNEAHKIAERDFKRVRRQGTQGTYPTLLKMTDGELTAPNSKQVEYLGSHPKAGGRKTLLNPLWQVHSTTSDRYLHSVSCRTRISCARRCYDRQWQL